MFIYTNELMLLSQLESNLMFIYILSLFYINSSNVISWVNKIAFCSVLLNKYLSTWQLWYKLKLFLLLAYILKRIINLTWDNLQVENIKDFMKLDVKSNCSLKSFDSTNQKKVWVTACGTCYNFRNLARLNKCKFFISALNGLKVNVWDSPSVV